MTILFSLIFYLWGRNYFLLQWRRNDSWGLNDFPLPLCKIYRDEMTFLLFSIFTKGAKWLLGTKWLSIAFISNIYGDEMTIFFISFFTMGAKWHLGAKWLSITSLKNTWGRNDFPFFSILQRDDKMIPGDEMTFYNLSIKYMWTKWPSFVSVCMVCLNKFGRNDYHFLGP